MDEMFEPRKKEKLDKNFFKSFIFIFIIGLFLVLGTSYSLEFFKANKNVGTINLRLGAISVDVTGDNSINATLTKQSDKDGITSGLAKTLTINNNNDVLARYILKLERTSGVELANIKYALMINNVIQKVDNVPNDGVLFNNIILGNETLNAKVILWIDNNYTGSVTTLVGSITSEIKRTYELVSDVLENVIDFDNILTATNNYVKFNNETYRIVKIENDRLVICKSSDFDSTATTRVNSNKFNSSLTYTDNSIIYSHSTDNKNLYLVKTVNIKSGKGTSTDPFILNNDREYIGDKKVLANITYKDGNTTLFTQSIYYNQINYIGYVKNDPDFIGWSTTNGATSADYELGDTISFTSNTNLYAVSAYVTLTSGCYTIKGNILTNEAEIKSYNDGYSPLCEYDNISIPSTIEGYTVTKIGDWSMAWNGLTGSVTIPDSVITIGEGAFFENGDLEGLTLGNSVETIGESAFAEDKIDSVIIPNSVTTIGSNAFIHNALTSLTLGNNVETIGNYAFQGGTDSYGNITSNRLTTLTIPDSVTYLGESAFECNELTSVTIGRGLTIISESAFACNLITSIQFGSDSNVEVIESSAFYSNYLTTLTIPNNVKRIEQNAFLYNSLTTLNLGSGIQYVDNSAFSDGDYDFMDCDEQQNCTFIRHYGSNNLTTVNLAASGDDAFNVCTSLPGGVDVIYNGRSHISPDGCE